MVKKFQITMSNKLFYTLIVVGVMGLLGAGVYAYNSGVSPSVMGHSAGEIEGVCRTDGTGCPAEKDPTVLASVKDGITWTEIANRPAGLDDGDDVGGNYCYTHYSTSLTSCTCPAGETNKKDLGSWGFCRPYIGDYFDGLFRPSGLSCADVHPWSVSSYDKNMGLACVCCG